MLERRTLDQFRSLEEMRSILDNFSVDCTNFSNPLVHRRRGLAKDIIEEYEPLYHLARELEGFASAKLTGESFPGPDAIIRLTDGSEVTLQITTAGETESTALQREKLSQGECVFPNQHATKVLPSKRITAQGRVLTTKKANTQRMMEEVKAALQRKIVAHRSGTQCLLIRIRQPSLTMESNWAARLGVALLHVGFSPYSGVYVTNTDKCTRCAGALP